MIVTTTLPEIGIATRAFATFGSDVLVRGKLGTSWTTATHNPDVNSYSPSLNCGDLLNGPARLQLTSPARTADWLQTVDWKSFCEVPATTSLRVSFPTVHFIMMAEWLKASLLLNGTKPLAQLFQRGTPFQGDFASTHNRKTQSQLHRDPNIVAPHWKRDFSFTGDMRYERDFNSQWNENKTHAHKT